MGKPNVVQHLMRFKYSVKILFIILMGFLSVVVVNGQITKLPYADTTQGNYFGTSVALDGNWAIVGASGQNSCDTGSGAAYIYELSDSTGYWRESAQLTPDDCQPGLAFGRKVALEGRIALVSGSREFFGNERPNAVYVYERNDDEQWLLTARLKSPSTDQREGAFGEDIEIAHDKILITTSGDPTPENERDGTVYLFQKDQHTWTLYDRLEASGTTARGIFGGNATLFDNTLAVASSSYFSRRSGSVFLFQLSEDGAWSEIAQLGGIQGFFISLDLYDKELIVGQSEAGPRESGQATLFAQDSTGAWQKTATLLPPTPYRKGAFGTEVALYKDRALVVGYDEQLRLNYNVDRVVYNYRRQNGQWQYRGILDIGNASFGSAIDLNGNTALIGAASGSEPGNAYVIIIP